MGSGLSGSERDALDAVFYSDFEMRNRHLDSGNLLPYRKQWALVMGNIHLQYMLSYIIHHFVRLVSPTATLTYHRVNCVSKPCTHIRIYLCSPELQGRSLSGPIPLATL